VRDGPTRSIPTISVPDGYESFLPSSCGNQGVRARARLPGARLMVVDASRTPVAAQRGRPTFRPPRTRPHAAPYRKWSQPDRTGSLPRRWCGPCESWG
jgi:hypothetical protein